MKETVKKLNKEKASWRVHFDSSTFANLLPASFALENKSRWIEKIKAARKLDNYSLYTGINNILKSFQIHRAEYHGRDLTDVHLKQLMDNAEEIMKQIAQYLMDSRHVGSEEKDDNIKETCENVKSLLLLWDGALSNLHISFPSPEQCDETQKYIDAAIKLTTRECQKL